MIIRDNRNKFSGRAGQYAAGRPSYAIGFIKELHDIYGLSADTMVADIGSGTGKLTRQLLELGCTVFGVEPNVEMRQVAELELSSFPNFWSVDGDASSTGLPDESVDVITAAQAFHWFPVEEFREECLRIGREGCPIFLIWNQRDMDSPAVRDLYRLYSLFGKDFKGFNGGLRQDDDRIRNFFHDAYSMKEYDNPLYYSKEEFCARCLSSSNAPLPEEEAYEMYVAEAERIFDCYAEEGKLKMPNMTTVYAGVLKRQK